METLSQYALLKIDASFNMPVHQCFEQDDWSWLDEPEEKPKKKKHKRRG